jgi:hypothetical protein
MQKINARMTTTALVVAALLGTVVMMIGVNQRAAAIAINEKGVKIDTGEDDGGQLEIAINEKGKPSCALRPCVTVEVEDDGIELEVAIGEKGKPAVVVDSDDALDFAFDVADVDPDGTEDDDGGGGDGTQDDANVQQQDSTQDRTQGDNNVNENTQVREQRQSERIVTDDGGGDGGPQRD